eukprot:CAMPEP_0117655904 /NCGR_PEP_ID=MMETSP0804-20121206/4523_1 /TAXON_ID=1074897 /ORGANISM="Tetraselmis astigmatica, Strain CCMP880" /LENGTH=162 /DNA_ID=CAMNT_0005462277 /DNA_START=278 /DNA_END=767 /DNA_ORIENTATION=-
MGPRGVARGGRRLPSERLLFCSSAIACSPAGLAAYQILVGLFTRHPMQGKEAAGVAILLYIAITPPVSDISLQPEEVDNIRVPFIHAIDLKDEVILEALWQTALQCLWPKVFIDAHAIWRCSQARQLVGDKGMEAFWRLLISASRFVTGEETTRPRLVQEAR